MRRGIALIIVVGVLAVLAVVATAFVMMAELERKASRQRLLSTKAYLLARSGLEDALARLDLGQDPDAADNKYWGEDWDASGGALSAMEAAQEVYQAGTPNRTDCPLRHAMRPNFFVRRTDGKPLPREVDGRERGFTGSLAGEYGRYGNHYALMVSSPSGFYVNGGDPLAGAGVGYNAVLRRILGTLAKAIDEEQGGINGFPVSEADGWNLINARPPSGWSNFQEIKSAALGGNQAKLDALKPYLVLKAWVDKRVTVPNPYTGALPKNYESWGQIKLDHASVVAGSKAPDFERIPTVGGKIVGRAPVYLGWARARKPALIALLAGLKGHYYSASGTATNAFTGDLVGTLNSVEVTNSWVAGDRCHLLANALFGWAGPLDTWSQWNDWCDLMASPNENDVLKANFNPNTDLNKFNPNPSMWKKVDKSDLLLYSTEFSLFPLQGKEIQSVGRMLGKDGRLLAIRTLRATLPGPNAVRLSTQKEFVCENLGDLDAPGDESNPRVPGFHLAGPTQAFLSQSQGSVKTWGHTLDTRKAIDPSYASSWMNGASPGAGLQSYPEPCYDTTPNLQETIPDATATTLMIQPADYDGNLQLATVETQADAWYNVGAPRNMMMLARFDDGLDLDVADGYTAVTPDGKDCQVDPSLVTRALLGNSVWASDIRINTLYPDGCYSEKDRSPAYFDRNSVNGFHGLMSFWLKRNLDTSAQRGSQYVRWVREYGTVPATKKDPAWRDSHYFFAGYAVNDWFSPAIVRQFTTHFEIARGQLDNDLEHRFTDPRKNSAIEHRWHLLTVYYDFQGADSNSTGELVADGSFVASVNDYYYVANSPASAQDNTTGDMGGDPSTSVGGRHLICLGPHGSSLSNNSQNEALGLGADTTLDEFAVYDFGAGGGTPAGPAATYASNRYNDGRYYKEATYRAPDAPPLVVPPSGGEAGSWISAPITLPAGSVLQKVAWTWYRPRTTNFSFWNDYAEVELLQGDASDYLEANEAKSRSTQGAGWTNALQSWQVNRVLPGTFRARVVFRRGTTPSSNIAVPLGTPLLDSPVFDDLTFVYDPPGGKRFTAWEEGGP